MVISKALFAWVLKTTDSLSLRQWDQFRVYMGLFLLTALHSKTYSMLNILFMYGNKCLIGSIEHLNIWILKRPVIQLYACVYFSISSNENLDMSVSSSTVKMGEIDCWNLLLMSKTIQSSYGWSNLDRWHNPVVART